MLSYSKKMMVLLNQTEIKGKDQTVMIKKTMILLKLKIISNRTLNGALNPLCKILNLLYFLYSRFTYQIKKAASICFLTSYLSAEIL